MQIKYCQKKLEYNTYRIPLSNDKFAIVSPEDYGWLSLYKWKARQSASCWYAMRTYIHNNRECSIRMHREIMHCAETEEVHHINKNTLDNRRENLHCCTQEEHQTIHKFG
jgi:arylamine N-acetyltransferase